MVFKKNDMFDYTTSHTPQLNGVIERIFEVVKEVALAMILNAKFNDTAQKMLWSEAVHTYKKVWKIQAVQRSRLEISMGRN